MMHRNEAKRSSRLTTSLALCIFAAIWISACSGRESDNQTEQEAAVKPEVAESQQTMHVYKSPTCGCCGDWVDHVNEAGFVTEVTNTEAMNEIKTRFGIDASFHSCHTAVIGDYVFEGHIPAHVIQRFLEEKPDALGLAVPGMPIGSPGMEMGDRRDPYDVLIIRKDGTGAVYEHIAGG